MPGRLSLALGPQGPLVKRDLEILPDALREHVNALAADIGPRTQGLLWVISKRYDQQRSSSLRD